MAYIGMCPVWATFAPRDGDPSDGDPSDGDPSDGVVSDMRKILLLAANTDSSNRRRLDEEARDIGEGLKRSRQRDVFEIVQQWAVRPRDLHQIGRAHV